eukprot:m.480654 g.480654  ORF g.480654 m.480654 type:complete len:419 (-) comp21917_c0_seq1:296-1552(-)
MATARYLSLLLSVLLMAAASSAEAVYTALLSVEYRIGGQLVREELRDTAYYSYFGNTTATKGMLVASFSTAQRRARREIRMVNACSAIIPGVRTSGPWIALVSRGGCRFASKAYNAARAGAAGVLVMNTADGEPPRMAGDIGGIAAAGTIPSVSITRQTGNHLVTLLNQRQNVIMRLAVGDKDGDSQPQISAAWLLGHVIVFAGTIMAVSLVVLATYYCRMRRVRREELQEVQHTEQVLERLPTRRFSSALELANLPTPEDAPTCAVCLDDFDDGEELRVLPCKHEFHQACVDPWLTSNQTCPLCKANIMEADLDVLPTITEESRQQQPANAAAEPSSPAASTTSTAQAAPVVHADDSLSSDGVDSIDAADNEADDAPVRVVLEMQMHEPSNDHAAASQATDQGNTSAGYLEVGDTAA